MLSSVKRYTGDFYDKDYYENGPKSGKGWLENYSWMPERSYKEAQAYINYFGLNKNSKVLDVGTAKGFIVRALNELGVEAEGCDISKYALNISKKDKGTKDYYFWNCTKDSSWDKHINRNYTHAISKDVFEHLTKEQLPEVLNNIAKVTSKIMCVIPMGDNGKYRINEYHQEISHIIIENEDWWRDKFNECGWNVIKDCPHVPGLKDNWQTDNMLIGNCVFVLEKKK